ncbi:XRE family transcriptional regulator [Ralstonia pseudosolanacearum]
MIQAPIELAHSGNRSRNGEGQGDGDLRRLKAALATVIIEKLNSDGLTVREAHARTGFAAADFSRIRNSDLDRFTLDRLLSIIYRLGARVEVKVKVKPDSRTRRHAVA